MNKLIRTAVMCGLLGCGTASDATSPSLSVVRNRALNTQEVNADGGSWTFSLPPNYMVLSHDLKDDGEEMLAKSRFTVGNHAIMAVVAAIPWEEADKKMPIEVANLEMMAITGFTKLAGPNDMKFGDKLGSLIVGNVNGVMTMQFAFVTETHAYILRCSGDASAQTRVAWRCKNLLDRFQPIQSSQPVPHVDTVPKP